MTPVKDEMLLSPLTAKEVRDLVDEWVAAGGVITQCKPGSALNFRSQGIIEDGGASPKLRRPVTRHRPRRALKTKTKPKKN
jgi:hypothetical protein